MRGINLKKNEQTEEIAFEKSKIKSNIILDTNFLWPIFVSWNTEK